MSELTRSAQKLLSFLERIERLEEERKTLADDISDVYKELTGDGFDKDAAKVILKIRKSEDGLAKWTGASSTVDTYLSALGMLPPVIEHRAPARAREIIEKFDAETGEITEQPETVDETMGGLSVAAASETAEETGRTPAYTRMGRHGTPHGSGVTGGESAATENQERPSTNDKAYLEAVPQDQASLAGTGSRMLAGREGRSEGEAASVDLPTHSNPQPSSSPEADKPEAVSPPAVSGAHPKPLRPNCLNPGSNCAGYGDHTCHACKRAAAEAEAA